MCYRILCLLLICTACFPLPHEPGAFTAAEFDRMAQRMARGSTPDWPIEVFRWYQDSVLVLDTRQYAEYVVSHLPGAIWVGYDAATPERLADLPRDTTAVVYCSVGYRSERIGRKMQQLGFREVYNLQGSLFAWHNAGYPLVDSTGAVTDTIHGFNQKWAGWLNHRQ